MGFGGWATDVQHWAQRKNSFPNPQSVHGGADRRRQQSRELEALHPNAAPEQARDTRARVWAYVFSCYEKKKAAEQSGSP